MGKRCFFSLIELIIVIVVIAALMTLLLPLLDNAKIIAIKAKCASNLEQNTKAMTMYSSSYDGWITTAGANHTGWFEQPGIPEALGFSMPADISKAPELYRSVTLCPAGANDMMWVGNIAYGVAATKFFIEDYAGLKFEKVSPQGEQFVRLNAIAYASNYVLLADSAYTQYKVNEEVKTGTQCRVFCRRDEGIVSPAGYAICERHNGLANLAFADGHVQTSQDKIELLNDSKIGLYVDETGFEQTSITGD